VSSQAEADDFNCTIVTGSLLINGVSITHLDGLSELTAVGGTLEIINTAALENLDGLSALTTVGDNLVITDNAALTQFCGLFPLLSNDDGIGDGIQITGNGIAITVEDILAAGPCE
jgi:hypothetical protein